MGKFYRWPERAPAKPDGGLDVRTIQPMEVPDTIRKKYEEQSKRRHPTRSSSPG